MSINANSHKKVVNSRTKGYIYTQKIMKTWTIWTEEEIKLLRNNYNNLTQKEIAKALGKPISAIQHKVLDEGIGKRKVENRKIWTEKDIAKLREVYLYLSTEEMCKLFCVSATALRLKARDLGINKRHISFISNNRKDILEWALMGKSLDDISNRFSVPKNNISHIKNYYLSRHCRNCIQTKNCNFKAKCLKSKDKYCELFQLKIRW